MMKKFLASTSLVWIITTACGKAAPAPDQTTTAATPSTNPSTNPPPSPQAAPAPVAEGKPACGMRSNPNQAKDLGKATLKIDGTEMCANYWQTYGMAEGYRRDINLLGYTETGDLTQGGSSMPSPAAKSMMSLLSKDTRLAIGLSISKQVAEGGDYAEIVIELGGFTREEWQGPVSASVRPNSLGYAMSPDPKAKQAYLTGTFKQNGVTDTFGGMSGTVTFEAYDFAKQAFKGSFSGKLGPIEGVTKGTGERVVEGTFDIRGFD